MNQVAYNRGVATRSTINNSAAAAGTAVKDTFAALGSFFQGLVKGEQPVEAKPAKAKPAARRTTKQSVKK